MKALIQVVNEARVTADGEELGSIGRGLTVFSEFATAMAARTRNTWRISWSNCG